MEHTAWITNRAARYLRRHFPGPDYKPRRRRHGWIRKKMRGSIAYLLYPTGLLHQWVTLASCSWAPPPERYLSWALRPPASRISHPLMPAWWIGSARAMPPEEFRAYVLDNLATLRASAVSFSIVIDRVEASDVQELARLIGWAVLSGDPARILAEVGDPEGWCRLLLDADPF